MLSSLPLLVSKEAVQIVPSFRAWQSQVVRNGLLPVIGIAGSRGKSTALRMVDAILQHAHLRTATWSNLGIEIRGRRQRDELSAWSRALARLSECSLDVVIQEMDWLTVNAVGLPASSYPVMGITNQFPSRSIFPRFESAQFLRRTAIRVVNAVHIEGTLVVCGDDPALIDTASTTDANVIVTSLSRETPSLREHLDTGNIGVWSCQGNALIGRDSSSMAVTMTSRLGGTLAGTVPFEVSNALMAVGVASAIGIDMQTISDALGAFTVSTDDLPGSFNVLEGTRCRAVVDRIAQPSHVRAVLRAVNPGGSRRQVTVIGDMSALEPDDVQELGRLVGRTHGAVVMHSTHDPSVVERFRRGIASNDFPPLFINLPTERRALNRALQTVDQDDVILVLGSGDAGPSIRALQRFQQA